MKKTLIFAAIISAALAVSCQPKELAPDQPAAGNGRIFTCVIAQPDTRLDITDAGKTTWEAGDKIMIHGGTDGADRLEVTLTASDISADGKKATFSIEGLEPYDRADAGVVSSYYAQYPADLVPSGNMYYECCFQGTDAPLMAACNVDNTFTFYNLSGIISYTVKGSFDKVVFSGNNKETVAFDYYQVRVRDDGDGPKVNYHKPGNGFKNYSEFKSIEKEVVADGKTVNYIYLPKGVNFSGGFNFQFYDGEDLVKIAKTETAVNVDHSKILPLGNISSHLEDYVAPTFSDHTSSITGATDLSAANGPANCYIISSAGAYKLPVVSGNDPETVPGSVFGVELIWETYNNAEEVTANSIIAEVDFDGPTNYVYFKTPATLKPGNALIAAKDDLGKIIWSWHIWIPATTISVVDGDIHTTPLMSRNLGALIDAEASSTVVNDVTSAGLFYQWGRKDPFPGPSTFDEDYPSGAKVAGTATAINEGEISLTESIQNPNLYGKNGGDWCSNHNAEYWGDNGGKTIYDPCPAGYRVPKRDKTKALWNGDDDAFMAQTGWAYDGDHKWFTLGSPVVVFPLTGYMDSGTYNRCKAGRTVIWNAHADGDGNAYNRYIYNGPRAVSYSHNKSRGYSVRCCVDE